MLPNECYICIYSIQPHHTDSKCPYRDGYDTGVCGHYERCGNILKAHCRQCTHRTTCGWDNVEGTPWVCVCKFYKMGDPINTTIPIPTGPISRWRKITHAPSTKE
jgi:hypothetical protein